jgi:hypothetical protein
LKTFQHLPESARAVLAAGGIRPDDLIEVLAPGHDVAILLVGSHASGMAAADSDLDFLVLLEGAEQYAGPTVGNSLRMTADLVDRQLAQVGPLEVDIEIVRAEQLSARAAGLGGLGRLPERPAAVFDHFPVLHDIEIRALERLRSGIPLHGHGRIARWREQFHTGQLPLYRALTGYLAAMTWLEDAFGLRELDLSELAPAIAARAGAAELIAAALAYRGRVLLDLRFGQKFAKEWIGSGDPFPAVLSDFGRALFPRDPAGEEYIGYVYTSAVDLFQFFRRDGRHPGLADGIRWFGRDRWRLDRTFLDKNDP